MLALSLPSRKSAAHRLSSISYTGDSFSQHSSCARFNAWSRESLPDFAAPFLLQPIGPARFEDKVVYCTVAVLQNLRRCSQSA